MTIHQTPREALSAFKPMLGQKMPPPRFNEDDSLLVDIRDKIARAQNKPHLHAALMLLLGDAIAESRLEQISRTHPGMIGTLSPECEFPTIEGGA